MPKNINQAPPYFWFTFSPFLTPSQRGYNALQRLAGLFPSGVVILMSQCQVQYGKSSRRKRRVKVDEKSLNIQLYTDICWDKWDWKAGLRIPAFAGPCSVYSYSHHLWPWWMCSTTAEYRVANTLYYTFLSYQGIGSFMETETNYRGPISFLTNSPAVESARQNGQRCINSAIVRRCLKQQRKPA